MDDALREPSLTQFKVHFLQHMMETSSRSTFVTTQWTPFCPSVPNSSAQNSPQAHNYMKNPKEAWECKYTEKPRGNSTTRDWKAPLPSPTQANTTQPRSHSEAPDCQGRFVMLRVNAARHGCPSSLHAVCLSRALDHLGDCLLQQHRCIILATVNSVKYISLCTITTTTAATTTTIIIIIIFNNVFLLLLLL